MKRILLASLILFVCTGVVSSTPAGPRRVDDAGATSGRPLATGIGQTEPAKKEAATRKGSGRRETKGAKKPPAPLVFSWPVASRRIVTPYGERTNPQTKTVTVNPGINIAAKKGSGVTAAAAGRISLISWLPSFGTFIIVEHRDGYRTVYANLGTTALSKGASVTKGARLGTVGTSPSGTFLHFQVWRKQTRLDPATLLR
jgi:murein DD-endopeptidase MepM/ murein hydrolase activator NlpD